MRIIILFATLYSLVFCNLKAQSPLNYNLNALSKTHDNTAPNWGPYSKKYAGISHIADSTIGTRFDFSIAAGFFKGKIIIPNAKYISGYHPWKASADLEYFSFREQLEWKDKVYVDISFAPLNDHTRIMKIEMVNNTNELQGLAINYMAGLQYDVTPTKVLLPKGCIWHNAINYTTLTYKNPRADDNLRTDALRKGETRNNNFVGGSGLGDNFGKDAGDKVSYKLMNVTSLNKGHLLIRYKVAKNSNAVFKATGFFNGDITLNGTGEFVQQSIPVGELKQGLLSIELVAQTDAPIELDGFCIVDEPELKDVQFVPFVRNPKPEVDRKTVNKSVILKYPDLKQYYGICWDTDAFAMVREVITDDYDNAIKGSTENIYEHNYAVRRDAYTTNIYMRSFNIPANSRQVFYTLLCEGAKEEVASQIQAFLKNKNYTSVFEKNEAKDKAFENINPEGSPYIFSQERMKATMLQNIIYPIYAERELIKQFVPGKRWNSLYTWDCGFIGLGMLEIDVHRAIELLNGYTNPSTAENAYIHHGSPVPVQFFIYQEIWNRTQSKELLAYFYERLRNYYLFFTGQYGSSTTRKLKSNLLNTFDYFYNSGGWDDYPAQDFARHNKMYGTVAPVISSSLAIRIAKTMMFAAEILEKKGDIQKYKSDINMFTSSLQQNSWDEASGYFGYVTHDSQTLQPTGILRTKEGVNHNMGVDGIYPLVAGICTPQQKEKAMEHLFSPTQCWTPYGITVVDQSAPYYSVDGYWNGTVWFPHQYIIWRTMLDMGEGKRAAQIAQTALNLYKKEVDSTYNCFELVRLLTGRNFGWHQFSGLSAPVLNWFAAYYRPGTITVGYNGWIMNKTFNNDYTSLKAQFKFATEEKIAGILICMKSGPKYTVLVNGEEVSFDEHIPGVIFINYQVNKKLANILIRTK